MQRFVRAPQNNLHERMAKSNLNETTKRENLTLGDGEILSCVWQPIPG